jgi:hypothetical protein
MMKKIFLYISLLVLITLISNPDGVAQQSDSSKRVFKNTVRVNLTNPLIFGGKYLVFGYERILNPHQSASVNIGRFSIPKFVNFSDGLNLKNDFKDFGLHVSMDYRFYLKKENKYNAPRGVYVGPYFSYNYLKRENKWDLSTNDFTGEVATDFTLNIFTLGAQLGYQFVLWDRLAIDMILLGPGLGFYNAKVGLNTTLSAEDESLFFQKINDFLAQKIPGYDFTIDSGEFQKKGSFNVTSLGYRYMIHLGFRF